MFLIQFIDLFLGQIPFRDRDISDADLTGNPRDCCCSSGTPGQHRMKR
jgi:hypothetical protein